VELTYWTVQDDEDTLAPAIEAYRVKHPYVHVKVVQQAPENYSQALIQAWARGSGPDLFSVPNTELGTYSDFITPLPEQTSVYTYSVETVLFRKQRVIEKTSANSLSLARLGTDYIDVVASDVVRAGKIYGLPFSMDTLVVYYNRDLLNTAGIVNPASTWSELVDQAGRLTILDAQNNILQSAIALGEATNISHAADILTLLMQQNGTAMTDASGRTVLFNRGGADNNPGAQATQFFTDFADPTKEVFSWSKNLSGSLDAFVEGKTAYYIGTLDDQRELTTRRGPQRFDVAPMFHINEDGTDTSGITNARAKINAATYWIESVAKQSSHPDEAWSLLQYLARSDVVDSYLTTTNRVSALRKNLAAQVQAPELEVFASQALTARSWYHGENWPVTKTALEDMVTAVVDKTTSAAEAVEKAAKQIQLTYKKAT
jgi:ABC-type glycerol-3-phosphate transport system substrate-binding protein